jgi:hypothetical protein
MQRTASLRIVSLGLAAASLLFAGTVSAQTDSSTQSYQLVGVNARLDRTLDTNSVKQGQTIEAKLDGSVQTAAGVKLDKGTELLGTVTNVEASTGKSPSSLTVAFTSARTKDGKQIPVKVTLLAAYPSNAESEAAYGVDTMAPVPNHIDSQAQIDQESGTLNNIAMESKVQADNSGTFTKKDGNLKLTAGTFFQVGIAPTNGSAASNGE